MVRELLRRGHEVVGSGSRPAELVGCAAPYVQLDITDRAAVLAALREAKPDVAVHCAAWTAVDAAEDNAGACFAVNEGGTRNMAEACREIGAAMVYLSTDYVFSGEGSEPWRPEDRAFAPLNVYGESKLAGERAVEELLERFYIVRIAWVFGKNGRNFVRTMLNVGRTHDTVRVVSDQIGTPTYTYDLARLLVDMAETERYGIYHATNEGGFLSWYDFTREIYRLTGLGTAVLPVTTEEYGLSRARRPFNSRLDKSKLVREGFRPLPDWQDALERYLRETEEL